MSRCLAGWEILIGLAFVVCGVGTVAQAADLFETAERYVATKPEDRRALLQDLTAETTRALQQLLKLSEDQRRTAEQILVKRIPRKQQVIDQLIAYMTQWSGRAKKEGGQVSPSDVMHDAEYQQILKQAQQLQQEELAEIQTILTPEQQVAYAHFLEQRQTDAQYQAVTERLFKTHDRAYEHMAEHNPLTPQEHRQPDMPEVQRQAVEQWLRTHPNPWVKPSAVGESTEE